MSIGSVRRHRHPWPLKRAACWHGPMGRPAWAGIPLMRSLKSRNGVQKRACPHRTTAPWAKPAVAGRTGA